MPAQTVRDVMTADPVCLPPTATLVDAAQHMSKRGIGDVFVADDGRLTGILTDRDIVVRAIASGRDPSSTPVMDAASSPAATLQPTDAVEDAVRKMREHNVRRLPVLEADRVVGVVSLGDLAADRDPDSVLGEISRARPNN
jgi:CBS domain-containing protein